MVKLLEKFSKVAGERRKSAAEVYRDLLARADAPEPGDEERLADTLAELGLSPQDFERHHRARAEVARLEQQVTPTAKLDAMDVATREARAAMFAGAREMLKGMIDKLDETQLSGAWNYLSTWTGMSVDSPMEKRRAELLDSYQNAQIRATNARRTVGEARRRIDEVKQQNALAFATD